MTTAASAPTTDPEPTPIRSPAANPAITLVPLTASAPRPTPIRAPQPTGSEMDVNAAATATSTATPTNPVPTAVAAAESTSGLTRKIGSCDMKEGPNREGPNTTAARKRQ